MAGIQGVLVTGVAPDSPAAEAGIKQGDIVLQVNRMPVGSVAALRRPRSRRSPNGKPLLLLVRPERGRRPLRGARGALSVDRKIPPERPVNGGGGLHGPPPLSFSRPVLYAANRGDRDIAGSPDWRREPALRGSGREERGGCR